MKKLIIISLLVLPAAFSAKAQMDSTVMSKNSVWVHGLSYFWGHFRAEFDYSLKDGKNGIVMMPLIYFDNNGANEDNNMGENNYNLEGYGLDIAYRHYLKLDDESKQIGYIKAGLGYSYLKYSFKANGWFNYIGSDGLTYSEFRLGDQTQTNNRMDAFMLFGIKRDLKVGFYIDYYAGFVYKKSFVSKTYERIVDGSDLFSDHSVTGVMPRLGISLGFYL